MPWFDRIRQPIIALAPLADYTDEPFSRVCRQIGGPDFVIFREMVSAEAIIRGSQKTLDMCRFSANLRPIVIQIFGANPDSMAAAVKIIQTKFKPDGIDINMGCPVPKIAGKTQAGVALMKNHDLAVEIIKKIKSAAPEVVISVKTRLGWSRPDEILQFAPKLVGAGAQLITIHGRTKQQGYSGQADWEAIKQVKKIISIPLIANGDMANFADAQKCLVITGADGVMIGRGALGNPWVFGRQFVGGLKDRGADARDFKPITLKRKIKIIQQHARLHVERYSPNSITTFRKHLAWYFKSDKLGFDLSAIDAEKIKNAKNLKEIKKSLMRVSSLEELENIMNKII